MAPRGSLTRLKQKVADALHGRGGAGRPPRSPGATAGSRGQGPRSSGSTPTADDHAGTDGIEVSYEPDRDGDADPGEVVWAWVPYEDDPTQGKDRPVLILGWDGPELAGVQLSSKDHSDRRDAQDWISVGTGAWDSRGRPSYADAGRLLRFAPSNVRREGAALDEGRFTQVVARVTTVHGWTP